jgi:hypothetical protein
VEVRLNSVAAVRALRALPMFAVHNEAAATIWPPALATLVNVLVVPQALRNDPILKKQGEVIRLPTRHTLSSAAGAAGRDSV